MARLVLSAESVPRLPRHIVLRNDRHRGRWVLLAPERVLFPDEIAVSVLQRLDGRKTIAQLASELAETYAAPADLIERDVIALLQDLADRTFLTASEAATHG